jgi:hypothetical protein
LAQREHKGRAVNSSEADTTGLQGFDSFELRLGDELRGERATLGKSLLDVQRDLRIKASYIAAIEDCDLSVFENTGFLAGYVRSYARYLDLDPETTYARFCAESNFKGAHADLGRYREGASGTHVAAISASAVNDINPIFGRAAAASGVGIADFSFLAPLLVVVALIAGLIFGGWTLLKNIQRVDIAPVEQSPVVLDAVNVAGFADSASDALRERSGIQSMDLNRLYSDRALSVPVVTPRDGPIGAIAPQMAAVALPRSQAIVAAVKKLAKIGDPQVTVAARKHLISLFAQQEAWVRVSAADGSVLFEKLMAPGEKYTLPERADVSSLRAGNAGHVYLMIDGQVYGPVNGTNGVAKNVSLAAADIARNYPQLGTLTAEMRTASEGLTRAASLDSQY